MAKHWVLDTETKGTGAEMVPLEKVLERRRSARAAEDEQRRRRSRPRRHEPPAAEPQPRRPRRFKVVDVMTRRPVAEDVGMQETLELLNGFRSVVDVIVYAWDREREDWRPLTMREQKLLWESR